MRLRIALPNKHCARVDFSSVGRELTIDPTFTRGAGLFTIGYVTVTGDGGRERLWTIDVNAKTGKLSVSAVKPVQPQFDSLGPGDDTDTDIDGDVDIDVDSLETSGPGGLPDIVGPVGSNS